jgi:hypothetical protein
MIIRTTILGPNKAKHAVEVMVVIMMSIVCIVWGGGGGGITLVSINKPSKCFPKMYVYLHPFSLIMNKLLQIIEAYIWVCV